MSKSRVVPCLLSLAALTAASAPAAAVAAPSTHERAVYALANGCFAMAPAPVSGGPYTFKATGLGTFLLMDPAGQLLGVRDGDAVGAVGGIEAAGPAAEWAPKHVSGRTFTLRSTSAKRGLTASTAGALGLGPTATRLTLTPATGCATFPEADTGTTGRAPKPTRADGTVNGFADTHLHITAHMRAGGAVISGEPFDRFGIARALGEDAAVHGADGGLDATGNLLRDGVPFGTHDTAGWPSFSGWPVNNTNTHQQVYYAWLERAWRAGLRLTVAQTVEDSLLCKVEPRRRFGCDETTAIRRQIAYLRDLQDYIDAQSGGPGRGWFRLVTSPGAARRAIGRGQLAVLIGMESSFPLDCRAQPGRRPCTNAQVDRRLDALYAAGVRTMFIAHWADNGFAGAAVEGGVKGKFINALQRVETGHFFAVGRCPDPSQGEELQAISPLEIQVVGEFFPAAKALAQATPPSYPTGRRCNTRGLTKLGAHLVRRMAAKGMLIELDHMSERAREQVLRILARAHEPAVSGHSDTGGHWTTSELRRLTALGGVASQRLDAPAALAEEIVARTRYRSPKRWFGVGLGSDTGGFATLPGAPAAGTAPLAYPFHVNGSDVAFAQQRTGDRVFDFNTDGMAHYGLLPDLLAAMAREPHGQEATGLLFRSAEAYLRMWELARRR